MFGSACVTSVLTAGLKIEHVNSSGAVSPAARATAITVPVRIPPSVVGKTTPTVVRQRLTPSARLASRSDCGTRRSTSCEARATSGSMTIAIGHNGGLLKPGTLGGTLLQPAVNGVAIFTDLSVDQAGIDYYTLRASNPQLGTMESVPFSVLVP